jgi:hypothetical protein
MEDSDVDRIIPGIESNIGGPHVSYEEIGAVLSQADEAMELVRSSSYAGNLSNIAYIYNSTESGAFGVFDPNIDRSVKVKIVEEKMKSLGYETDFRDGHLYAWTPGKDASEVRDQMESLYSQLDIKGGLVIGINAAKIMEVSKKNLSDLSTEFSESENYLPIDNSDLDQMIAIHLGSTIVHETVHALGDKGEAGPIAAQNAWIQEVLPQINSARESQGRVPLEMSGGTYMASSSKRLVTSQTAGFLDAVLPEILLNHDRGPDPLWFVKKDVNDSMEAILSKNEHSPVDGNFITEKELEQDRQDQESCRMIIEDLLEEDRPHPIIVPLKKSAGINSNIGGPFISSPFSVDEMIPRVLDGTGIQDKIDYKEGEDPYWHYRYKPENRHLERDRFGRMSYVYDERLSVIDYDNNYAASWDSLFREDIVVGPWRRMGATADSTEKKNNTLSAIRTIGYYKNMVNSGQKNAARFICDEDISDNVLAMLSDSTTAIFDHGDEKVLWIFSKEVSRDKLIEIESAIIEGRDGEMVNDFMGTEEEIKRRINTIIQKAASVSQEHGISGVYIVGGFPRVLAGEGGFMDVNDLDFTSGNPGECLKLGGLIASEFNVDASIYHRTMTMSFEVLGVKSDFRGNFVISGVRELMRKKGIRVTPLNYDIYARDFTVNSLLYDFVENKIYDVTGNGLRDLEMKVIRTHFDPMEVIPINPLVITRAIIMNMRGFKIDDVLYESMKRLSGRIFETDISELRLAYEYDKIISYEDGEYMLKEFGLDRLKDISRKAKRENPELFN